MERGLKETRGERTSRKGQKPRKRNKVMCQGSAEAVVTTRSHKVFAVATTKRGKLKP
jgi:hypothetical protein